MFRSLFVFMLAICILVFSIGCEGGRDDILSLSLYNFSLVDDEESKAGGYTKLYMTIKDPSLNIEIFPNARAAIESKAWDTVWRHSVIAGKSSGNVIPQTIGFDDFDERDKFIKKLNSQSSEGISWNYKFHDYESEFLISEFDLPIVFAVEFKPVLPDYDNLTTAQILILDVEKPILVETDPSSYSYNVDILETMRSGIKLVFNEPVTGDITVSAGNLWLENLEWEIATKGNTITLKQGEDGELLHVGTDHIVEGTVQDAAGNKTDVWVYFRTSSNIEVPSIVSSNPKDGEAWVDPEQLFKDGITVEFDKNVVGKLYLKWDGEDVGWKSVNEGNIIRLIPSKGQELEFETEYQIEGTVEDEFGIEVDVRIVFVTEPLE